MNKNNFKRTGVVYYAPEMIRYIESITKEDLEGIKFKEILRYILDLVSDINVTYSLISDDEAKKLRELTLKYNVI